ncbi:cupin domain-containing protein [Haloferula sp. BvORR071]|uniref:cupin domain-containing protein n=1 Tax=Haloferula sp. BvORR071 TaxID=1396141 RepID=UPI00055355F0|nr:cupin domain-containing protein [Haloferula sp. BvORR071]
MATPKEIIKLGQIEIRFLLDGDDTNGTLSMFEFIVPPGARVPAPHYHEEFDEIAYGIEGTLSFTVDGKCNEIGPGERCFIPRGAIHHFENAGEVTSRTLAVLSPARMGAAYFRELAELFAGGPPDPAAVATIMRRHGLIVVPPSA